MINVIFSLYRNQNTTAVGSDIFLHSSTKLKLFIHSANTYLLSPAYHAPGTGPGNKDRVLKKTDSFPATIELNFIE